MCQLTLVLKSQPCVTLSTIKMFELEIQEIDWQTLKPVNVHSDDAVKIIVVFFGEFLTQLIDVRLVGGFVTNVPGCLPAVPGCTNVPGCLPG